MYFFVTLCPHNYDKLVVNYFSVLYIEFYVKVTTNITLSVFIDLSKAFDTISHNILLSKLDNLGIRGVANAWFKSYLSERKQYMEFHNITSPLENIICGFPQGSILKTSQ